MIDLKNTYNQEEVLDFLKNSFLRDFQKDIRAIDIRDKKDIQKAYYLGYSQELELSIFEFLHEGGTEKRVALTTEAFNVLRDSGNFKAIGIFHSKDTVDWRFSLMTATPVVNEKGKVKTILSNPKRYSFLLGPNAKVNTPTKFLITKGEILNFEDLKERFSIEVVNKEFYKEISKLFIQLVGGTLGKDKSKGRYKALLELPGIKDSSQTAQEFAVRLIGRLIFCWFLREKKNGSKQPLMPHSLLSLNASKNYKNYYHDVLEPIFFKVLNVPINSRKEEKYYSDPYNQIPYLNGGLFSPHEDDFYSTNDSKQERNNEQVIVPDKWLQELFEILETYNFTIDENSAFDEELSIDPEMLGRIFENLLAEINPETGESARKSTGSYYTPRVIVDYMVDESLYLYLKNKTDIEEEKLRSIISYDLDDDTHTPLTEDEKEKIIAAIDELKILDPACGSGAFPMGALQKVVFILQQLDPNGQYWFKAQIKNVPVELRKNLEREHSEKNFDYIRKLGVIRRNIFGVDIQPIATEISRLRCFLTLIVDQKVDDQKENRGIDPLPNLDFKFVTANSLISLPDKDNSKETIGMFEDTNRINELKDIRDQFFNASNFERIELKDQFRKIQLEMSRYYNSVRNAGANLTEMLLSWDPFSHKVTEWFDSEWMFGVKEGFDIVIANPPYGAEISDENMKSIKSRIQEVRNNNSAALFIDIAKNNFLKESGVLSYIVPKSLIYAQSWSSVVDVLKRRVSLLIDVEQAFDSVLLEQVVFVYDSINNYSSYEAVKFKDTEFLRSIHIEYEKLDRFHTWICDVNAKEMDIVDNINIECYLRDISSTKRGITIQKYLKDVGEIPVIGGKNICQFGIKGIKGYVNISDLNNTPKLKSLMHEKLISQRLVAHIQNPYPHLKIMSSLDKTGEILSVDTVENTSLENNQYSLEFICGLLNSSFVSWYAYKFIFGAAIRTMDLDDYYIGRIPIPNVAESDRIHFEKLVAEASKCSKEQDKEILKELKNSIDNMVFSFYGISRDVFLDAVKVRT